MRINLLLCGNIPLEQGVRSIGIYDIGMLILHVILAIFSSLSKNYRYLFPLPLNQSMTWVIVVRIVLIDLSRVFSFGLLLKRDATERPPRLIMFLTRLATMALHIFLISYTYTVLGTSGNIMKLILNIGALLADTYFTLVIFSYYKTSTHEEIEIELKRLGQQKVDAA